MKTTGSAIKLGIVSLVLTLITVSIVVVFAQMRFNRTNSYSAEFSNGSGLKNIALPVSATIGGLSAKVAYAGSAPGDVEGVMQIDLQIPSGLATGVQPVLITLGSGNTTYATQTGVTVQVQ